MKSCVRVKRINGIEYLYEDTPYYDREKKQIRHRSRYLGKNVDGRPVKKDKVTIKMPRNTYHYGEFLPLLDSVEKLGIGELLAGYLGEEQSRTLLALCFNRVVRPMPFYQTQSWFETVWLKGEWGLDLSGPRISELLASIGDSSIPDKFSRGLVQRSAPAGTLIYDITSFSSYSRQIELLEHGYNREHTGTRQVNLSLVMDKEKMIPLLYDVYPGSITDMSTLLNTVKKIGAMGILDYMLVLDRGFFSTANIDELMKSGLRFVIPATLQLKTVKQLVSRVHRTINDPNNLHMYGKETLFAKSAELQIGEHHLKGYCYYSPRKEHGDQESFYQRLHDLKERLERMRLKSWMKPYHVFQETCKGYSQCYTWKFSEGRFHVNIKKNAVAQRVNKMGMYILFTNDDLSWDECLSTYKTRDIVEKGFDLLKNDLEARPLNVQRENTLRGLLFVNFLSLILKMRLLQQMSQTGLHEKYTINSLLFELEKIKKVELEDGTQVTTPLTKKQKDILDPLELCA
jgi:transposase